MTPAFAARACFFGILPCVLKPGMLASGMLFVLGSTDALSLCILLAHKGAFLGRAEVLVSAEVVDLGVEIGPHDSVGGAVRLGEGLAGELACCRRQPSSGRSGSRFLGRCCGARRRRRRRLGGWRRRSCGRGCSYAAGAALIAIRPGMPWRSSAAQAPSPKEPGRRPSPHTSRQESAFSCHHLMRLGHPHHPAGDAFRSANSVRTSHFHAGHRQ